MGQPCGSTTTSSSNIPPTMVRALLAAAAAFQVVSGRTVINMYDGTNDLIKTTNAVCSTTTGTACTADADCPTGETCTGSTETYFKIDATGANYELGLTGSTINIKGAAYTTSDRRLKDDIADLDDATASIDALRGVRYSWVKEAPGADGTKRRFLGFLAQEVEDVLPELVSTDAEGTKSVNYVGVVPVLVEALKEERAARTALEARLDAVEARLAALDTIIES